ncbi:Uncharacterised protein [Mesomycoplasma neurolyticum]|uniref:Uncharacterized protein n=2 Tax=Mesomycoplasma neurolyticum TaxID=2120 RepID=A0A449A581_9BACT|nr:Uncharacterised protein [Mesomycoplasma neurolyticum]
MFSAVTIISLAITTTVLITKNKKNNNNNNNNSNYTMPKLSKNNLPPINLPKKPRQNEVNIDDELKLFEKDSEQEKSTFDDKKSNVFFQKLEKLYKKISKKFLNIFTDDDKIIFRERFKSFRPRRISEIWNLIDIVQSLPNIQKTQILKVAFISYKVIYKTYKYNNEIMLWNALIQGKRIFSWKNILILGITWLAIKAIL